jgi:hypothetical protein
MLKKQKLFIWTMIKAVGVDIDVEVNKMALGAYILNSLAVCVKNYFH